jgi:hypothetical protein
MTDYPTAMFRIEETDNGIVYWPANSLATGLCAIAGKRRLKEEQMDYVRKHFRVVEPNGAALPYPKKIEVFA